MIQLVVQQTLAAFQFLWVLLGKIVGVQFAKLLRSGQLSTSAGFIALSNIPSSANSFAAGVGQRILCGHISIMYEAIWSKLQGLVPCLVLQLHASILIHPWRISCWQGNQQPVLTAASNGPFADHDVHVQLSQKT